MGSRWSKDSIYIRAMKEGYRSRAAFKLMEIQDRYSVIRRNDNVVDLGSAPGSWLQVVRNLTDGIVLGIDLSPVPPLEGVVTISGDFTETEIQKSVGARVPVVNVIISDAAPRLSGHRSYDQARAIGLGMEALAFASTMLKPGGNFVVKSFQGEDFGDLLNETRKHFFSVRTYRCRASRKGSAEIYIIAKNCVRAYGSEGSV
jgi:23S rRNA (uridine2552-2'-O)-methyltransferase